MNNPKISVIMPVYNRERYLKESINSILGQTFSDFEFLIINDCSTDNSEKIIENFAKKDKRIIYIKNDKNYGQTISSNIALKQAKGKYIVKMDSDDISHRKRLAIQYDFMEKHENIGVCGSWYRNFYNSHKKKCKPITSEDIKASLLFENVIGQPTVIIRKSVLNANDIMYDESFKKSEDYDLWVRLSYLTNFYNIPKILLKYRVHENQIGHISDDSYDRKIREFQSKKILESLKIKKENLMIKENQFLFDLEPNFPIEDFAKLENWINYLILQNEKVGFYYNDTSFKKVLLNRYWRICKNFGKIGAKTFYNSNLRKLISLPLEISLKSFFYSKFSVKN